MVISRGEIWWVELEDPEGSGPGYRRPIIVVQSDAFNRSQIATTVAVALTSNLRLADAPGNVVIPSRDSGLPKDSVANVSKLLTLDKSMLQARVGKLTSRYLRAVTAGLKLVLSA